MPKKYFVDTDGRVIDEKMANREDHPLKGVFSVFASVTRSIAEARAEAAMDRAERKTEKEMDRVINNTYLG